MIERLSETMSAALVSMVGNKFSPIPKKISFYMNFFFVFSDSSQPKICKTTQTPF